MTGAPRLLMKGHRTGTAGAENSIGIDQGRILDMRRIRLSRLKAGILTAAISDQKMGLVDHMHRFALRPRLQATRGNYRCLLEDITRKTTYCSTMTDSTW